AMAQYRHAASLNPGLGVAWRGIAAAASALGDRPSMVEAAAHLEQLEPRGRAVYDARKWLEADPPREEPWRIRRPGGRMVEAPIQSEPAELDREPGRFEMGLSAAASRVTAATPCP